MTTQTPSWPPTAGALKATFDATAAYAVGLEDEVMLLDPEDFELAPRAERVLSLLGDDTRFKLELPASQLEIVTPATPTVGEAVTALRHARQELAQRTDGLVRLAAAGVHPTSPGSGKLNNLERYEHTVREYGTLAARQLVCALQVHVSVGDATRALAVYNAARSYLPLLAALAANAPFYEAHDTGLASLRPKLAELLPRQGVPPELAGWDAYAEALHWGAASDAFPDGRSWWWELRLHPTFGTLEFRVPDGQSTAGDAAAIAAVAQSLVAWLGERHDAGERLAVDPSWRIAENRWCACRDGVDGTMVDLKSGHRRATRECLEALLAALEPFAGRLGASAYLAHAGTLMNVNGAISQRRVAADSGIDAVPRWLTSRFLD